MRQDDRGRREIGNHGVPCVLCGQLLAKSRMGVMAHMRRTHGMTNRETFEMLGWEIRKSLWPGKV